MAKATEESQIESLDKPPLSSVQETPIPTTSLPNLRLDRIRDLAARGLIKIGKQAMKQK